MSEMNYVTFTERGTSLYPSYRPMYKIAQIVLILYYNGFAYRASLLKLHLFSWALKSKDNLLTLLSFSESNYQSKLNFFSIESTLNRALNLAYAEKLIDFNNGSYSLLEKGKKFAVLIDKDVELFTDEKNILKLIGKRISEKVINDLTKEWKNA